MKEGHPPIQDDPIPPLNLPTSAARSSLNAIMMFVGSLKTQQDRCTTSLKIISPNKSEFLVVVSLI